MPQLTIDVPETLMPLLIQKAEAFRETPEAFIVSNLSTTLECLNDDVAVLMNYEAADQERLEDILEERDKGPFVELPDNWVEQTLAKARQRAQETRASACHA